MAFDNNPTRQLEALADRLHHDRTFSHTTIGALAGASTAFALGLALPPVFLLVFGLLTLAGLLWAGQRAPQ